MPESIKSNVKNFIDAQVQAAAVKHGVPVEQIENSVAGEPDDYKDCAFCSLIVTTWVKDRRDETQEMVTERFIAGGDATTPTL